MEQKIIRELESLPLHAQCQVYDFIDFLKSRYKKDELKKIAVSSNIEDEPFFGMWKDRDDMKDSSRWVRK